MTTTWADVFMPLPSTMTAMPLGSRGNRSVVGRDPALGDATLDERLELLGDRLVLLRRPVGLEQRLPDPVRLRRQLRRAGFLPRLVVAPIAEHRLVERRAVARLRVL